MKSNIVIPSFFVVGAQKAGTTTLFDIFSKHPEIYMPQKKETRFFSWHYENGFDWYSKQYFSIGRDNVLTGEISPDYLCNAEVPKRIKKHCGENVKIIILMRHPAKRAYSQYIMNHKFEKKRFYDWIKYPFEKQVEQEYINKIPSSYIEQGLYYKHYKRYEEHFPKENILLVLFEDLVGEKKTVTLNKIMSFLGVQALPQLNNVHSNKASLPKYSGLNFIYSQNRFAKLLRNSISRFPILKNSVQNVVTKSPPNLEKEAFKRITQKYFREDIEELEAHLGYTINQWEL